VRRSPGTGHRPLDGLAQTVAVDRFQQVIERMDLECPHRVLIVRGHEDDARLVSLAEGGHHFEAVEAGHLDVEQHHIRHVFPDCFYRFLPVGAGGYHLGVRFRLKQPHEALAAHRLVIGHNDSQRHCTRSSKSSRGSGTGVCAASQWVNGSRSVATAPPPEAGSSVKRALTP
jgi:hypothetical protein